MANRARPAVQQTPGASPICLSPDASAGEPTLGPLPRFTWTKDAASTMPTENQVRYDGSHNPINEPPQSSQSARNRTHTTLPSTSMPTTTPNLDRDGARPRRREN